MTTSFQMFLLAARELSFSRAAEIAFVTPQCLSDHIRRIEEQYGVTLFVRKPHLRLTPEGETMLRYLNRIQTLEGDMKNELADVSGGSRGTLRLGIPVTRGNILLPGVVTDFQRRFPNVETEIRLSDTRNLEEQLLAGKLDLFLGVDTTQHALFSRQPITSEPLYLVISRGVLEKQFGNRYAAVRESFRRDGADLALLQGVPFVQGHSRSTTTMAVEQLLLRENISLAFPVRVSNFDLHIEFCHRNQCATICSRSHIRKVMDLSDARLETFAIRNPHQKLQIELITHRDAQPLAYRTVFAELLRLRVLEEEADICGWLKERGIAAL